MSQRFYFAMAGPIQSNLVTTTLKYFAYFSTFLAVLKAIQLWTTGRCKCKTTLVGKTVLITGGSSGIGYCTALDLASRGCRLIIGCRSDPEILKDKIFKATSNANVVVKYLDLASFESVRIFAKEIVDTEERLDILINNAGIGHGGNKPTVDGFDPMMQINYFGPFLLTHLLIDLLKKSSPSRIVFVSSSFAYLDCLSGKRFKEEANSNEKIWKSMLFYGCTKLNVIAASNEFARRLRPAGITSNSLHTGFTKSEIWNKTYDAAGSYLLTRWFFSFLILLYGKTLEEGAQTTIHLATSKNLDGVSGCFFMGCKMALMPSRAENKAFVKAMWEESEQLVHLTKNEKL